MATSALSWWDVQYSLLVGRTLAVRGGRRGDVRFYPAACSSYVTRSVFDSVAKLSRPLNPRSFVPAERLPLIGLSWVPATAPGSPRGHSLTHVRLSSDTTDGSPVVAIGRDEIERPTDESGSVKNDSETPTMTL